MRKNSLKRGARKGYFDHLIRKRDNTFDDIILKKKKLRLLDLRKFDLVFLYRVLRDHFSVGKTKFDNIVRVTEYDAIKFSNTKQFNQFEKFREKSCKIGNKLGTNRFGLIRKNYDAFDFSDEILQLISSSVPVPRRII